MRVFQITTCDEGLTNPKRSNFGITFALRGGDTLTTLGHELKHCFDGAWHSTGIVQSRDWK